MPWPVIPVAPFGRVHVYEDTFDCCGTEYVAAGEPVPINAQTLVGPLIKPGVAGFARVTVKLLVPLAPQSFTAVTVMELVVKLLLKKGLWQ